MGNIAFKAPRKAASSTVTAAAGIVASQSLDAEPHAPRFAQIGIPDSILSASNWEERLLFGIVDTGIGTEKAPVAPGQVSNSTTRRTR